MQLAHTRLIVTLVATGALAIAFAVPRGSAEASSGPYTADIAPDLTSFTSVIVDGTSLRTSVWQNFQKYVAGCMQARGLTYVVPTPPASSSESTTLPSTVTTGSQAPSKSFNLRGAATYVRANAAPSSQGVAATNARAFMRALRGVEIDSTTDKYLRTLDWRAYDGLTSNPYGFAADDTGGCESEGRQAVVEPAIGAMQQVDALAGPVFADLLAGEPATDVNEDWSQCMASQGQAYADVLQPKAVLEAQASSLRSANATSAQWDTFEVSERQTASASQSCMDSAGVTEYLATDVQSQWNQFCAAHTALIYVAGGRTLATGGAQ